MVVKSRNNTRVKKTPEFEAFVDEGGTAEASPAPSPASATPSPAKRHAPARAAGGDERPQWVRRAESDKKTEGQPLRYNRSQADLLARAKALDGRTYSTILAELVWPVLEEQYGSDVPIPGE